MHISLFRRISNITGGGTRRARQLSIPIYRLRHLLTLLCLAMLLLACAHEQQQLRGLPKGGDGRSGIPVDFTYVDAGARDVALVGSFGRWSPQPMSRTGQAWTLTVPLPSGRYQYGFLINGKEWRPDPGAEVFEENGFGGRNSILIVE